MSAVYIKLRLYTMDIRFKMCIPLIQVRQWYVLKCNNNKVLLLSCEWAGLPCKGCDWESGSWQKLGSVFLRCKPFRSILYRGDAVDRYVQNPLSLPAGDSHSTSNNGFSAGLITFKSNLLLCLCSCWLQSVTVSPFPVYSSVHLPSDRIKYSTSMHQPITGWQSKAAILLDLD